MPHERPYSHLRASDADRERVAKFLREQHAVGRLNHDELEDRLGRAYRAVTMGDLDRLIGDLPQPGRPAPRRAAPPRRRPPSSALVPFGLAAALLAFAGPTVALVMFAVMAAVGVAVMVSVFAIGVALGPFLIVGLLVMLALRRNRRAPRRMHWRYD
jgi:Domain of unknown function (DUF1707)